LLAILKICSIYLILCFVINNYSRCFGRNISKDPKFDFSQVWHLIVGLYAAKILKLVFNRQKYASKFFYLSSHILSLSSSSLQHPRHAAGAAAHCCSSQLPTSIVTAHSCSSLCRLASSFYHWPWLRFPFFSCRFYPCRFCCTQRGARSPRGAAPYGAGNARSRGSTCSLCGAFAFPARALAFPRPSYSASARRRLSCLRHQ
jgi:hypothetical protein